MNMVKDYNVKDYKRSDNKNGLKAIAILLALIAVLVATTGTASAAVNGITKDNYSDYVKPVADVYGYNVGECEREYLEGEEYFYNDHIDHWNVDKVYDASLIPTGWNKTTEAKATTTKAKAKKAKKKAKKSNKTIVKTFCKKKFKGYKIKFVKEGKVPKIRKGKRVVYVEVMHTVSKGGKKGKGKTGTIRYFKNVKKGKKITCFVIWNPKTNVIDDVSAFVAQNRIR